MYVTFTSGTLQQRVNDVCNLYWW